MPLVSKVDAGEKELERRAWRVEAGEWRPGHGGRGWRVENMYIPHVFIYFPW